MTDTAQQRALAGWLLFGYFVTWLHWLPLFPLLPVGWNDPVPGVPLLGICPRLFLSRLFLYGLTLPVWISLLALMGLPLLARYQPGLRWVRLTLALSWLVASLFCLQDVRLWNGFQLFHQAAVLIWLILPRPAAWLRQLLAAYTLLAAFALAGPWWLKGEVLAQHTGLPYPLALGLAWLLLVALLGGALEYTQAKSSRYPWLAGILGLLYLISALGGMSPHEGGEASLLLALGLSVLLHQSQDAPYSGAAHGSLALLTVVLMLVNSIWPATWGLLPCTYVTPPLQVSATYSIQSAGAQMLVHCKRIPGPGWRNRRDLISSEFQSGSQAPVYRDRLTQSVTFQGEAVFDPEFWTRSPSPLLATPWYHRRWQAWLQARHPDWKVLVSAELDNRGMP